MPTTLLARLRIRRDTYANLYATNRVYGRGEPVYDETNDKIKVGDGITAWRDIDYMDADAAVATLKDVQLNLGTLANGQTLVYDSVLQKWVNSTAGGAPSGAAGGDLAGTYPNPTVALGAIGTTKLGGDITTAGKALLDDLDAAAQRTTLGLGTVATQNANAVALTGGTISGINVITGTYQSPANEALVKLVRKASAGTITKGQVVYIVGSQGTHLTVELADADSELTAATTIGVATETITGTTSGYILIQGYLDGLSNLPTASFTDGAALWLSSTAGDWTTTRPTQPAHGVFLGWVVSASNGAAGRAYVKVINGQELDELHDVLISGVADGHILQYETGLWRNRTLSAAGVASATHVHGNITSAGAIGSTANLPIITGTSGVLQAGSFGSTAGTFCAGDDSRLSDARTPTGSAGGSLTGTYPNPTIASAAVTSAMLRNSTALSVIGRSANTAGVPADIAATVDGQVLRLSGTTLGFGTVATAGIGDAQVTYAKIQNINTARILGRTTAAAGSVEEISVGSNLSLSGGTLAVTASGATTQVQFNDGGTTLGGHSGLTYDKTTSNLTIAGDLAVNGGDITTTVTSGTANLFTGITTGTLNVATAGASTINLGGTASSVNIGTTTGDSTLTIRGSSIAGQATLAVNSGVALANVFNTIASTLNIGGAATSVVLGATTGTAQLRNPTLRLGNTTSLVTTNSGTSNSLTLQPSGNLILSATNSTGSVGGTYGAVTVTNGADGTGQVRVTGGNLYLGTFSTDGTDSLDVGILFEGATSNAFTTRLQAADPGANRTITLPNASGTVGLVAGSTNQVQYNSSGALAASSAFTFDGSHLQVGSQGQVRLGSSGATYVALRSPATVTNSNIYTLPAAVGTANQVLQILSVSGNDATLQWATVSGGSGSPGGSSGQIQFNSSGTFAGDADLTWTTASNTLGIGAANGILIQPGSASVDAFISSFAATGLSIEHSSSIKLGDIGGVSNSTYLHLDDITATATFSGYSTVDMAAASLKVNSLELGQAEFITNPVNGRIDLGPNGTHPSQPSQDYYALTINGQSWGFGVALGVRNTRTNALNTGGIRYDTTVSTLNDVDFALGAAGWFNLSQRGSTQVCLTVGLLLGSDNAQSSGSMVLVQNSAKGNANRIPTTDHVDPTLYLYGRGSSNANHFMRLNHDTTNGVIETGAGDLNLVSASGNINNNGNRIPKVFSGTTAPGAGLGSDGDLYFKY